MGKRALGRRITVGVKRHLFLPLCSEVTGAGQGSSRPQGEQVKGYEDISGLLLALCVNPLWLFPEPLHFQGERTD